MPQAATKTQPTIHTNTSTCVDCGAPSMMLFTDGNSVDWCANGHVTVVEGKRPLVVYTFGCLDAQAPQEDNDNADEL